MWPRGYRKRRHYTEAEKALMWDRCQKCDSMNEIGRWFGIQGHSSIHSVFYVSPGRREPQKRILERPHPTGCLRPEVDMENPAN